MRLIDALEGAHRLPAREPVHRFGHHEEHHRDQRRRDGGAEVEDRAPVAVALQEPRRDHAAEHGADRIADRHQRHAEIAPPGVGEFGGDGVDRGQHAADSQSGDDPPDRQIDDAANRRRHQHADGHDHEAAQNRRPTADPVGDAAEQDRADGHADQLHRQHDPKRAWLEPPLPLDAGRRKADRQHVEPVEGVERNGDRHDRHLQSAHRLPGNDVPRVSRHHGRIYSSAWNGFRHTKAAWRYRWTRAVVMACPTWRVVCSAP